MHTPERQAPGFQPQAGVGKPNSLGPHLFEVTFPGQELVDAPAHPFVQRSANSWATPPPPSSPPTPPPQGNPGHTEVELDWRPQFSLYPEGQSAPPPPRHWHLQAKPLMDRLNGPDTPAAEQVAAPEMRTDHTAATSLQRQTTDEVQVSPFGETNPSIVQRQQLGSTPGAATSASPYSTLLPGYSQAGDTCGAASLVTALMIWDREHWDATQPNQRIVTACNLILTELSRHGSTAIGLWVSHPAPEISRACNGEAACIRSTYTTVLQNMTNRLQQIRDNSRQPGAQVPQPDYKVLGMALYFLWHSNSQSGLSASQIQQIQSSLGINDTAPTASGNIQSFDDIFNHSIVTGLQPDQFAQVSWFVNTGAQHAFLIGHLQSGEWFLSDQGPSPAQEFRGPSLADLQSTVRTAAVSRRYWLFVGTSGEYINRFGILPGWTGVTRLGANTGVAARAQNLVAPGAFLGEVDAGWTTTGNRITRDAFISQSYSLSEAQAQFPTATHGGGLIVEMPRGVFTLYTTSAVSNDNLTQTSLDAADSGGGVLVSRTFLHAWLILGTAAGRHGTWFSVY